MISTPSLKTATNASVKIPYLNPEERDSFALASKSSDIFLFCAIHMIIVVRTADASIMMIPSKILEESPLNPPAIF